MAEFLNPSKIFHKNGKEIILKSGKRNIQQFWRWGYSDLIQNITRGVLAEFIVAWALDLDYKPRDPWRAYDLLTNNKKRVEVKSTGYLQEWYRKRKFPENIHPKFVICQTRRWTAEEGMQKEPTFNADIYVLCYHNEKDFNNIDPMNLNQWEFWVFTEKEIINLLRGRKSITISQLKKEGFNPLTIELLSQKVL